VWPLVDESGEKLRRFCAIAIAASVNIDIRNNRFMVSALTVSPKDIAVLVLKADS
jgi:hypothetical protein